MRVRGDGSLRQGVNPRFRRTPARCYDHVVESENRPETDPTDDVPAPEEEPTEPTEAPEVTRLPLADGRERSLDPRSVTVSRMGGAIGFGITFLGTTVALIVLLLVAGFPSAVRLGMFAAWLLLNGFLGWHAWFWPAISYRYTAWKLDDRGMRIRRGVLWRSETSVPKSRVQHTDVSQGPIQRSFGIATLTIHTAGTQSASVPLAGVSHEDALAIRDHLIDGGDDDGV